MQSCWLIGKINHLLVALVGGALKQMGVVIDGQVGGRVM